MAEQYNYLKTIKSDPHKSLFLVEDTINHRILIQAIIRNGNEQLYRQLQNLNLPAIPHIYAIEEKGKFLYVYEQYVPYATLDHYLDTHPVAENEAIAIMKQLLQILNILHHQTPPIIHRDIKPENIFYGDHKIILTDFDIARRHQEAAKTKDTTVLGSLGYASPEQFGFNETDVTSDIYSCGILFNVLLTGDFPMAKKADGALGTIITKATMVAPADRYQDVNEFIDALDNYTGHPIVNYVKKHRRKVLGHTIFFFLTTAFIIWAFVDNSSLKNYTFGDYIIAALFLYYLFYAGLFIYLKRDHLNRLRLYRKGGPIRHLFIGIILWYILMTFSTYFIEIFFPVLKP